MLCDNCGKNDASVHLTEIVDEQMTELHLCDECARKKSVEMEQQFGLSDLLAGLVDFGKQVEGQEISKVKCNNCNLSYDDFKKVGRLGCSQCYESFSRYLNPLLRKIHGATLHTGKTPFGVSAEKKPRVRTARVVKTVVKTKDGLQDLKEKLHLAIKQENFEEAATLRDKIRDLEKKSSRQKK